MESKSGLVNNLTLTAPMEERGQKLLSELDELAEGGLEAFIAKVPDPVLLVGPGAKLGNLNDSTSKEEDVSTGTMPSGVPGSEQPTVVIPVVKRFTTSVADMIWLGRAVTCDVILPYDAVSKVHAVLSHHASGDLLVTDVGSKNGTWINGKRLQSGQQVPLRDRDVLKLGNVQALFLVPRSLYDFVKAEAEERKG